MATLASEATAERCEEKAANARGNLEPNRSRQPKKSAAAGFPVSST